MLKTILLCLIFIIGLTPAIVSLGWLWIHQRSKERAQARLRDSMQTSTIRVVSRNHLPPDQYYLEGVGYLIGDISCQFNARSAYIRCAVNPSGPCQNCPHYQPKD
ncbi:MAG TPA: hypothetical protein DCY91_27325 [Cyanobacteria bacterium UBA11370]|nr:hypothetical protein [Cyanobacteria bacterium UBA11370]HBY78137.1 hypothetical protein [Cyanobacteria bacterium UBA11148]